jgi:hypothetical protein
MTALSFLGLESPAYHRGAEYYTRHHRADGRGA